MSWCAKCEVDRPGMVPEDVPDELVTVMAAAVSAAVAEATGTDWGTRPGGVKDCGYFDRHVPCDVLTKAQRMIARRFGVRMMDEVSR